MDVELLEFAKKAAAEGFSRERIQEVLRQAGWSEADVRRVTAAAGPIDFPIPVPRPRPHLSAREALTYALFFTGLYLSVFNLGWLAFHLGSQNGGEAQPAASMVYYRAGQRAMIADALRANGAALAVSFPLFLFLFRTVTASVARESAMMEAGPRRWISATGVFAAATALVGDLSALVYNALAGELRTAFVVTVLAVGVVAGGALGFFLTDLRKSDPA